MKILFVCNSIPFPARHGVELPLSYLIRKLSVRHEVDLVVLVSNSQERDDFKQRISNIPIEVRKIDAIDVIGRKGLFAVAKELLCVAPLFLRDQIDARELTSIMKNRVYDVAWISPIGAIGLYFACNRIGIRLANTIAIGQNDVVTYLYWSSFREAWKTKDGFEFRRLLQGIRLPWLWYFERKYLRSVELVHVQTALEKRRMRNILGVGTSNRVLEASNGKKLELSSVVSNEIETRKILFMCQLGGPYSKKYYWFLNRVWPRVLREVPDAELLLVGSLPKNMDQVHDWLPENVTFCGYVDSLTDVFNSVALSVVPTRHGCGWINRIADSLVAGVPVVACSEPINTIPGLKVGVNILKGDSEIEFANNVVRLLTDSKLRKKISTNSRKLGDSLPSWDDSIERIESALREQISKNDGDNPGSIS